MAVTLATTADRVLRVARGELGTVESPAGSNRTRYGAWYGLDANPWCAMFLVWCFHRAGAGDLRDVLSDRGLAYTPAFAAACRRAGWPAVSPAAVEAGDIVFFDFPDAVFRIQHVGVAVGRDGGNVVCVEGNTSVSSNDNGGKVMQRIRPPAHIEAVYRPEYQQEGLTVSDVNKILARIDSARDEAKENTRHLDAHLHQIQEAQDALDRRVRELLSRLPSTFQVEVRKNTRRAAAAAGYPRHLIDGAHTIDEDGVDVADLPVQQLAERMAHSDQLLTNVELLVRQATGAAPPPEPDGE